jgi:hypothetical protein
MSNMTCKLALLAGVGLALGSMSYAPQAEARTQVTVGVGIRVAPPPPRYERVPRARVGYVWAPGYWRWNARAHRHVWVGGYWVRARPGYRYHPARWEHRGDEWRFHRGDWGR